MPLNKPKDFKIIVPHKRVNLKTTIAPVGPLKVRQKGLAKRKNLKYAHCKLCNNRIVSARYNLMNHVRRHATLKQFQCVHCSYGHSEMTMVI